MLHPAIYDAHFVVHVGICDRIRTRPKIKLKCNMDVHGVKSLN